MKNRITLLVVILIPVWLLGGFNSAQFYQLTMEYGAIDAGTAGAFSTTDYSNYCVDHNPALLMLGNKFSYSSSFNNFNIVVPIDFYYNTTAFRFNKFACGFGYYYMNNVYFPSRAYSMSFSSRATKKSTYGFTLKYIHSKITYVRTNNFCVGLGYYLYNQFENLSYKKMDFSDNNFSQYFNNNNMNFSRGLNFGFSLRNIGPHVTFIDYDQSDPLPQEINIGVSYSPLITNLISVKVGYEFEKDLVSSYPNRDVDGDGEIGGYDSDGDEDIAGIYSSNGKIESAHTDKWYQSLITSWADDWFLLYDSAVDGIGTNDEDGDLTDGSLKNELKSINHHFGAEVALIGWLGFKYGIIKNEISDSHVNAWGFYFGPDFLRYHYSKYSRIYDEYDVHYDLKFHTIEFNYTPNFTKIIEKIFK